MGLQSIQNLVALASFIHGFYYVISIFPYRTVHLSSIYFPLTQNIGYLHGYVLYSVSYL